MPAPLPVGGLTVASVALTSIVIGNAYYQKKQFYPSVVYITKSNPSMAAIYLLAFTLVVLFGKALKKVFFGQLRTAEFEQLVERSFYAVTETCLAFTVFRDDFSPKFVALFTVLLFLKAFHYLTDSRVDFMERSPVITLLFHARVASLLFSLMMLDLGLLNHSYLSTITHGASVQLVFGFEYAILLTVGLNVAVKYVCHSIDLRSENPWENKAVYLLYTELLVGFVKVILYGVFLFIMIRIHTFPLFIIRPMYLTIRSFKNALNDVIHSRRAIHNMNTLYPDASPEELSAVDNVCIICREEMTTGAKKLPCSHIFHTSCLRSWFQRQQTCPTCRMDILSAPTSAANASQQRNAAQQNQGQAAPAQPQQQQQQPIPPMQNPFAALFGPPGAQGNIRPPFPPFPAFAFNRMDQAVPNQQASTEGSSSTTSQSAGAGAASQAQTGIPTVPTFMPFHPFNIPPPAPPVNFAGLTLSELEQMEGRERANVEQRIKALKNVQILLDAAVLQLSQYSSIKSKLEAEDAVSKQSSDLADEKKDCAETEKVEEAVLPKKSDVSTDDMNSLISETATLPDLTSVDSPPSEPVPVPDEGDDSKKIPDAGEDDVSSDPGEIRRRRLEKFTSSEQDS